jgi:hypothetical protein
VSRITVTFRVSCPVPAGSQFTYGYHWRPGNAHAFEHRMRTANYYHGYNLDAKRCVLNHSRITMVGQLEMRNAKNAGQAALHVSSYLGWILQTVYGHDMDLYGNVDVPGLTLSVREVSRLPDAA